MEKLRPYPLSIKRGGDYTLAPRITLTIGADLTGWTSTWIIKTLAGAVAFTKNSVITPEVGTPHIGSASFPLTETETASLALGAKYNYVVKVTDGGTYDDVYLHGPLDSYVVAGGV